MFKIKSSNEQCMFLRYSVVSIETIKERVLDRVYSDKGLQSFYDG